MKVRVLVFLVASLVRLIGMTLRFQMIGEEAALAKQRALGTGLVLVSWHGRTFLPIVKYRNRGYWSMVSTSRDGDLQALLFAKFGILTVRGSSANRGAIQATLKMAKQLKAGAILAHTPDGPRGPSHEFQTGAVFLAHRAGCPIVPVGVSAWPRVLFKSWDRYLIPLPFARAVMLYGDPVLIPAEAGPEEQEEIAKRLGVETDRLEREAERLAGVPPGKQI